MTLRILLADDHPVITAAIRARLQSQTGWEVCGEVISATDLLQQTDLLRPDIVVTDYHMPGPAELDGVRLLTALRRRYPAMAEQNRRHNDIHQENAQYRKRNECIALLRKPFYQDKTRK